MDRQVASQRPVGAGALIAALARPLRTPRGATLTGLWLFGLFALFLAPAPSKITPEKQALYLERVRDAQGLVKELAAAEHRLLDARLALRDVSVWFWRWRPEHREAVLKAQGPVRAAEAEVAALRDRRDSYLRDAKSALGLWSEAGIEESRELLWANFASGKVFAQRQTLWDSIFALIDSREKDTLFLLFQVLLSALVNYTVGTVISIVTFVISLPGLLSTFAPSFLSGAVFFAVAVVAALSLLVSYLALLYGAGAAVVVTTAAFVTAQRQRLEASGARRPEALRYRQHYD